MSIILGDANKFNGRPVTTMAPNIGDLYTWNGYEWVLTESSGSVGLTSFMGRTTPAAVLTDADIAAVVPGVTTGYVMTWNGAAWVAQAAPSAGGGTAPIITPNANGIADYTVLDTDTLVTVNQGITGLGRIITDINGGGSTATYPISSHTASFTAHDQGRPISIFMQPSTIGSVTNANNAVTTATSLFDSNTLTTPSDYAGPGYCMSICGSVISLPDATTFPRGVPLRIQRSVFDTSLGIILIVPALLNGTTQTVSNPSNGVNNQTIGGQNKLGLLNVFWMNQQEQNVITASGAGIYGRHTDGAGYTLMSDGTPDWKILDWPRLIGLSNYSPCLSVGYTLGNSAGSGYMQALDVMGQSGGSGNYNGGIPGGAAQFYAFGTGNPNPPGTLYTVGTPSGGSQDTAQINLTAVAVVPHTGVFDCEFQSSGNLTGGGNGAGTGLLSDFTGQNAKLHTWSTVDVSWRTGSTPFTRQPASRGAISSFLDRGGQGVPWSPYTGGFNNFLLPGELIVAAAGSIGNASGTQLLIENSPNVVRITAA